MLPEYDFKPYQLKSTKNQKLVISTSLKDRFLTQTAKLQGKVFHLQFQQQANPEQIGLSNMTKLLLYEMNDLPNLCTLQSYNFCENDELTHFEVYLYYNSRVNEAKKQFSHQMLNTKFKQLFYQHYFNDGQVVVFPCKKYQFDARIVIKDQQKKNGFISGKTKITFKSELYQNFAIKNQDFNGEQTQQNQQNPESLNYSDYKAKLRKIKVGGLTKQLDQIARRVFVSRNFGGAFIEKIGIKHAKGILLYGPPGTGKTLLARELCQVLDAQYKLVNGPQIMDKYFGEGEKKLREIFQPAIKQWKQKKYQSSLHVIIFDQIDAITKKRGGSDSALGDSLVNQLLTLIDGVDSPNNILVIGMTNRRDIIDDALLRAGRLQLHIEIYLPNEKGRQQIFDIHLESLKREGLIANEVDTYELAKAMKNYTGAEIQLLVRSAWSIAAQENQKNGKNKSEIKIKNQHFKLARNDINPQFGQDEKQIQNLIPDKPINYIRFMPQIKTQVEKWLKKYGTLQQGKLTLLIKGPSCSGKSTLAAKCCKFIDVPFTKLISPDKIYKLNQAQKAQYLIQIFQDSKRCDQSCIILDDLLRLLQYVPLSSKYSNILLQLVLNIIKSSPERGKKQIIIVTCDSVKVLDQLGISSLFRSSIQMKTLNSEQVQTLLLQNNYNTQKLEQYDVGYKQFTIGDVVEMILQSHNNKL